MTIIRIKLFHILTSFNCTVIICELSRTSSNVSCVDVCYAIDEWCYNIIWRTASLLLVKCTGTSTRDCHVWSTCITISISNVGCAWWSYVSNGWGYMHCFDNWGHCVGCSTCVAWIRVQNARGGACAVTCVITSVAITADITNNTRHKERGNSKFHHLCVEGCCESF